MTSGELVSHRLLCGCGSRNDSRPHIAVVWRLALPGAVAEPWPTATAVVAVGSCAVRHDAEHLIALVPCDSMVTGAGMGHMIDEWHRRIGANIGPVSAGRSSPHAGPDGLEHAMSEAFGALHLGERAHGPGSLTAYGDIFILDYATRLLADPRLFGLYDRVPSRLSAIEGGELLRTLEAFLATGSLQEAAVRLNVHRNSVKNRLKRIAEITLVDLEDPETRFLVQLALHAHRELADQMQPSGSTRSRR